MDYAFHVIHYWKWRNNNCSFSALYINKIEFMHILKTAQIEYLNFVCFFLFFYIILNTFKSYI